MTAADNDRLPLLTRRTLVLGGIKSALLLTILGRLFYLQVLQSDRYRTLAEDNRISLKLIPPTRGYILDRAGKPMATNRQGFRAELVPEQAGKKTGAVLERMTALLSLTEEDLEKIRRDMKKQRRFFPVVLGEDLDWKQVSAIELAIPDLPGVSITAGEMRHYPAADLTAHLTGYVGAVSESDLAQGQEDSPVLSLPGFRIGKNGVERENDTVLRGTASGAQLEVNALGRVVRELSRDEGERGRKVTLEADLDLQQFVQKRLAEQVSAAAVVLDIHTGGILALASWPAYD
nr:penicillin-binding protein 2 [Pseudomonadota bacterium]